jgi:hypothetical protein
MTDLPAECLWTVKLSLWISDPTHSYCGVQDGCCYLQELWIKGWGLHNEDYSDLLITEIKVAVQLLISTNGKANNQEYIILTR